MRKGFLYLFTFAVIILSLASCTATKYVPDGSYLLDEVKIHTDQKNVRPSSLRMYVRQNPNLSVEGIVMTMADTRTNLSNDVVTAVHEHFPDLLYKTMIPRSVRLGEAPSYGEPIIAYDPKCKASDAYRALSREVKRRAK